MAYWKPAGYKSEELEDDSRNLDISEGSFYLDPMNLEDSAISLQIQPVGFVDDFPSKYYLKPKHKKESSPGNFVFCPKSEFGATDKLVTDLINQCRYLANKKGMSKQEIIASIKNDEIEGINYRCIETIVSPTDFGIFPFSMSKSKIDPNEMSYPDDYWYFPTHVKGQQEMNALYSTSEFANVLEPCIEIDPSSHLNFNTITPEMNYCEYGQEGVLIRPQTRRNSSGIPLKSKENPISNHFEEEYDLFEEESELDLQLLEAAELMNAIGMDQYCNKNNAFKQQTEGTQSITGNPPVRTFGTHNFSSLEGHSYKKHIVKAQNVKENQEESSSPTSNFPIKGDSKYIDDSEGESINNSEQNSYLEWGLESRTFCVPNCTIPKDQILE